MLNGRMSHSVDLGIMMLKIGLFIDVANQVEALSIANRSQRVNYWNLKEYFSEYLLWKQKIYGIYFTDEGVDFIKVLASLDYRPSFIKVRPNEVPPNRIAEIMLDIIDAYPKLDIVAIGSNSVEFIPLIKWLQARSVRVWIITPVLMHEEGDLNIDLLKENGMVELIEKIQSGPRNNDPKEQHERETTKTEAKSSLGEASQGTSSESSASIEEGL